MPIRSSGGPLNQLSTDYMLNTPKHTIPVMKLIKVHNIKTCKELEDQINLHNVKRNPQCKCGIKGNGDICDWANSLYDAQMREWKQHRYTIDECNEWMHNLFITNSIKGAEIENTAIEMLRKELPVEYIIREATYVEDVHYRVDIVIEANQKISGVQVKPISYMYAPKEIILSNNIENKKWGHPVFYWYYDRGVLMNCSEMYHTICNHHSSTLLLQRCK